LGDVLEIAKKPTKAKRLSSSDRRAQILEAAIKFFSEEGFEASTHAFAKKLGVTQPLIYRYFPSKDDLIREVYNSMFESRWNPEWEALLRDRRTELRSRLFEFYVLYTRVVFARDWMRIYLFSGLRGLEINRWWTHFVEAKILSTVCDELRYECGADPVSVRPPTPLEMEILWSFQGGIFYYAMRRDVYRSKVHLEFQPFLGMMLDDLIGAYKQRHGGFAGAVEASSAEAKGNSAETE
jgi:AcrR family transcriptional regulator